MADEILNKAHEYVKSLREECKRTERSGHQVDFWDAFAIARPSGENAVYWLLPELRKVQAERDAALAAAAQARAAMVQLGNQLNWTEDIPQSYADAINALRAAITDARGEV